jgi:hypothetical protein
VCAARRRARRPVPSLIGIICKSKPAYRAYQASAWDTLRRPVSQDPRSGSLSSLSTRLYYADLAAVAPAAGQLPSIELPAAQATARDQLHMCC